MDTSIFERIEASQAAKQTGAALVATDNQKLVDLTAKRDADASTQVTLVSTADKDLQDGIAFLQSLLSTAPDPNATQPLS